MNWQHFQAFLWLRWRMLLNQLRKSGTVNTVLVAIAAGFMILFSLGLFLTMLLVGLLVLPHVPPVILLFVWDGLVLAFLFAWSTGLLVELQRAEALSLDRFLHLPVSLTGAFVINYLSSILLSVSLVLFLPPMLALAVASLFAYGWQTVVVLPLLAAFLLMVTALTYQFQGWLASLMSNPRRRRTVIVVVTAGFVLLLQLPNIIANTIRPMVEKPVGQRLEDIRRQEGELHRALTEKTMTWEEVEKRRAELVKRRQAQTEEEDQRTWEQVQQTTRLTNIAFPPGWLALGAADAAQGSLLPAALGFLGMAMIGTLSLWRSYRTTLRLYTGQFSAGKRAAVAKPAPAAGLSEAGYKPPAGVTLVEWQLPWLSEQTSVIALSSFRSLLRAPEAKMLLIGPIIIIAILGGIFLAHGLNPPHAVRPLMASGALAMTFVFLMQLAGNQFGFDRDGFRAYVLSPVDRARVFLGKNLALAPLAFTVGLAMIGVTQFLGPMRIDYLLAALPQMVSMYFIYCLLANLLSIFAPMRIAPGSLQPKNPRLTIVLYQFAFMLLFPFAMLPTLAPFGVQLLSEALGWTHFVPIALVLSLVLCAGVLALYRLLIRWQGGLLQKHEQSILESVTTKA